MKLFKLVTSVFLVLILFNCKEGSQISYDTEFHKDSNAFTYETVTNDPTGLRLYTLDNGFKVYMSKNTDEPKIQTYIAVRAGSNYDPKETTGLAHYLEHMLFKGTDKIGTLDWDKEKILIDQISDLYEVHKSESDPERKKEIYRKIDSVSLLASNYSIANELDKMITSLGATGTNAGTWYERTVYYNKIPSNELDKWLMLEEERFSKLVLRLFHTELESVFEEFNRIQDNDSRKSLYAMMNGLFPTHPLGNQTTIGNAEHLKNPSMVAIHNYFDKYYVPNNMAMVLVGDLEFEETIKKVNNTFGKLEKKDIKHPSMPVEEPITSPVIKEVYGPTTENVSIAFRSDGSGSAEEKMVTLCDMILANGNAGLIDLNLNQKQVVQGASCSPTFYNDYGYHNFTGTPKEGQTLDEVKELIFEQIEKLKSGDFEDWMIEAVVNDLKLNQTRRYENSTALASAYYEAFIRHVDWKDRIKFLDDLKNISKQELVNFANSFYGNNYVITYKRQGEDTNVVKVEKPEISPVNLNRGEGSEFFMNFTKIESGSLEPQYVDYAEAIEEKVIDNGLKVSYVENESNDLFNLEIIFDMGSDNDKKLALAFGYMEYLGTDTYSAEDLKKEFYKLGIDYHVVTDVDKSYVGISGLKENLSKGLELLENLWDNAIPNQEAYDKFIDQIAKARQNNKLQKDNILFDGLLSYGKYGENSRLRNIIPINELRIIDPEELVDLVKGVKSYQHRIFYYGKDLDVAVNAINTYHKIDSNLKDYPEAIEYPESETGGHVYFVDYDMVQSEMIFLAKGETFDPKNIAAANLFNDYFGNGLSSIVYQEIRESKALAYGVQVIYRTASEKGKSDDLVAYIGTQANKLPNAVEAMMELMDNMPEAEEQFNNAKDAALKKIAAQRINKSNIFWSYESLKKRGIDYDNREEIYKALEEMTLKDLHDFFDKHVKGENYNVMVIGNKKNMDFNALGKLGEVEELDVDYLFNYEKPEEVKL
ncbi:insulinase family protein [Flavobacteriaceae bacterium XHP0103]|uniref:M16 family metallopeptidase n=1 Tax=Marixanthotalea marina TaxID=2844359 RepID=UPI002989B7A2|nr:insulinase family protein [Marixanthotalea marina]MBU3822259.1 insulinase family protein [Marixanthotalea marina]